MSFPGYSWREKEGVRRKDSGSEREQKYWIFTYSLSISLLTGGKICGIDKRHEGKLTSSGWIVFPLFMFFFFFFLLRCAFFNADQTELDLLIKFWLADFLFMTISVNPERMIFNRSEIWLKGWCCHRNSLICGLTLKTYYFLFPLA